jgi:hypothetical protein
MLTTFSDKTSLRAIIMNFSSTPEHIYNVFSSHQISTIDILFKFPLSPIHRLFYAPRFDIYDNIW